VITVEARKFLSNLKVNSFYKLVVKGSFAGCYRYTCEAITEQAFFSWTVGQAAGPMNLPATAADLPESDRRR
jgi:hypothetical protein